MGRLSKVELLVGKGRPADTAPRARASVRTGLLGIRPAWPYHPRAPSWDHIRAGRRVSRKGLESMMANLSLGLELSPRVAGLADAAQREAGSASAARFFVS